MGRFDGKVVIVTGAARGQGEAEARLFASEGAKVVLADVLDTEGQAVAADIGANALYVHLDVSNEAEWQAAIAATKEFGGRLDALVNNAAIIWPSAIEDTSLEAYMTVINVNQVGCFLGMKTAMPLMKESGGGSIVNISSSDGIAAKNGLISYSASKFAIRGMTKTAAMEIQSTIQSSKQCRISNKQFSASAIQTKLPRQSRSLQVRKPATSLAQNLSLTVVGSPDDLNPAFPAQAQQLKDSVTTHDQRRTRSVHCGLDT